MTKYAIGLALLLCALGYVGEMDYQDRAGRSCEAKGGDWNGSECWKNFKEVKV